MRAQLGRIAYVDHSAELGGAEVSLCNLVGLLDRTRWLPSAVLWEAGPLASRLEALGIAVTVVQMQASLSLFRRSQVAGPKQLNPTIVRATLRQVSLVRNELRRSRADLVHANSLKACIVAGMAGRLTGIPVIWQVHSIVSDAKMRPAAVRLFRWLGRWLPVHIICNSRATASCFAGIPNVSIIPCGVNSASFSTNRRHTNGTARVGMIARFSHEKGQQVLLDAAERLSRGSRQIDWTFAGSAMFGEDKYQRDMEVRVQQGPIAERVRFVGFVDDVPTLMDGLDIVVHPSVEPEGLGQTVIEAMMAGKSVVVSAAGGSAELIDDGVTGRLVPPGDAAALASAIDDLLSNPARAAEMGRRAREVALERYDIRNTVRAIEDVYEKVLGEA